LVKKELFMKKGALIGKGMTAEVYEWGHDKVLKLFFSRYDDERIKYEADIGTIVHEAGVPSPEVFGVVDVDGRKGIIFQRIFGKSMLKHIQAEPWKMYDYAQKLAGVQFKIHQCSASLLPSQKERLSFIIGKSAQRLGSKEQRILDYLDSLPDGISVCHGDVHFNNVIVSGNELVAVDWNSAYKGNPLGDVSRTCLLINSPTVLQGIPDAMMMLSRYVKWLTCRTYLDEYMKLAKIRSGDIDAWILPIAAAKLKDKAPGEDKLLMDIINKRLEHLQCLT
jgi:uncharacterized protein (TIGR02172 family)